MSVRWSRRVVRCSSLAPSHASSCAMCLLTVEMPMPKCRAAAEKLFRSTTCTHAPIAVSRSIVVGDLSRVRRGHCPLRRLVARATALHSRTTMNAASRWVLLIAFALGTASHAATPTVTIRRIAVTGDHAPGTPPDVTFFGDLEADAGTVPLIDEDGRVGFAASLAPGVIPNEMGIWIERDGALTLVVRHGDQVPGLAPGITFAIGGFFSNQPNVANG